MKYLFSLSIYDHIFKLFANCVIIIILVVLSTPNSWGEDPCKPNSIGADVCAYARNIAQTISESLPIKMSQNITVEKAFAIENIVNIVAILSYKIDFLEEIAEQSGISMEELRSKMIDSTRFNICDHKSPTSSFIGL